MAGELAGSQISALLEAVPGIANVLRSPVADALVNLIRAGAGMAEFRFEDAQELVHYAVRRGLVGSDEGERLLQEVEAKLEKRRAARAVKPKSKPKSKVKSRVTHPKARAAARLRKKGR